MAMLLAHGEGSREAVTEERLQFGKQGRMGVVTGQRRCCFHGFFPRNKPLVCARRRYWQPEQVPSGR
jgi:hypothetical protein